jgi:uncharacterized protein YcfJ
MLDGKSAGPLAGGIIGGVLGSRLGRGRGNMPLAVAGALVGASIGRRLSEPAYGPPTYSNVQRCTTVNHYEQRQQLSSVCALTWIRLTVPERWLQQYDD